MKIVDCEKQISRKMDLYNKLDKYNNELCDITINTDKNDIKVHDVYRMVNLVMHSFKTAPEIREQINDCFKDFDMTKFMEFLDKIDDTLNTLTSMFNLDKPSPFSTAISGKQGNLKFIRNNVTDRNITLTNIQNILNFSVSGFNLDTIKEVVDIEYIFYSCTKARMVIFQYMTSLELPNQPDWELNN